MSDSSPSPPPDAAPSTFGQQRRSSQQQQQFDAPPQDAGAGGAELGDDDAGAVPLSLELESSFFPLPPTHLWSRYTSDNAALLDKALASTSEDERQERFEQRVAVPQPAATGGAVEPVHVLKLRDLAPPSLEGVQKRGHYFLYGEAWPIREAALPSLEELGVRVMYDPTTRSDRRDVLKGLLRTIVSKYVQVLDTLSRREDDSTTSSSTGSSSTQAERRQRLDSHVDELRDTAINMHHVLNELRPVQASEQLKKLLRDKIDARRDKARELDRCVALSCTASEQPLTLLA